MTYKEWNLTEVHFFPYMWKRQRPGDKTRTVYHESLTSAKREIDKEENTTDGI